MITILAKFCKWTYESLLNCRWTSNYLGGNDSEVVKRDVSFPMKC